MALNLDFKVLFAILAGIVGVGYLVMTGVSDTGVYYRTVGEVRAEADNLGDRPIRVGGEVVEGSVYYDRTALVLTFRVRDAEDGAKTMEVLYRGVRPDAFREGGEVILEGSYRPEANRFEAATLLAKCPSKYQAADPAAAEGSR